MTKNNQAAFDYLDHYLDRSPSGEGAVLVRGPWGSGKTHSLKAYLATRDARRLKDEPLADRHIYASLYGVATHEQLIERIFAARHPLLNHTVLRAALESGSRLMNFITRNAAVKQSDGAGLRKFILSLRDAVIVLDDLERSILPAKEIMGFLNNFVEHENVKAILVAAEDKIEDRKFEIDKEKLIVRTVEIRSKPEDVYAYFANRLYSSFAKRVALSTKEAVLRDFDAAGLHNLRSLRVALGDFDRMVIAFDDVLQNSEEAAAELLRQTVVMWAYLRAGNIKPADFQAPADLALAAYRASTGEEPDRQLDRILAAHRDIEWLDPVIPTAALASLAATGELDAPVLRETLTRHPLVVGPTLTPAWRRLWRWPQLSTVDFAEVAAQLLGDLDAFRVRHPGEILHVAGTAIDLSLQGYQLGGRQPVDLLTSYIDDLAERELLEATFRLHDAIDFSSHEGLGFAASETSEFVEIRQHLLGRVEAAVDRRTAAAAEQVLRRLATGDFGPLTGYAPEDGCFRGVPFLHHIDPGEFASILLVDGVVTPQLPTILVERYRNHSHDPHLLKPEFDWVRSLKAELDRRTAILTPPHRDWAVGIFANTFGKILAHLPPRT